MPALAERVGAERHTTFYRPEEISYEEPGGNLVTFAKYARDGLGSVRLLPRYVHFSYLNLSPDEAREVENVLKTMRQVVDRAGK
jgi:hypothetical protein